jgi:site-specific DNA-methyltransferase (adenine-specific)
MAGKISDAVVRPAGNGIYTTNLTRRPEAVTRDIDHVMPNGKEPGSLKLERKVALKNGKLMVGVITGNAVAALKTLPADTFNTAITSPPYYWARDYEISGQIGHEDTAEEYVATLVETFEEVRRVLHPEGVFYLNIGDTYYSGNGQPHGSDPRSPSRNFMRKKMRAVDRSGWDIPKKSLIGIPWRVAFAMQAAGWTLRSDIIWNRCNAFTEPTALDRPYRQYEHVFLFTKTRFYSYDRSQLSEEDVWNIPIERSKRIDHNAIFPRELVRRCVLTGSPEGGYVLDPFSGSGTSLEVAMELGRHAVGIDLSSKYTHDFISHLKKGECQEVEWKTLQAALKKPVKLWDSWSGNRRNYRKPGTAKKNGTNGTAASVLVELGDEHDKILHHQPRPAGD